MPLKVLEPPLGLSVRVDALPYPLALPLMTAPPLPPLSESEASCWLAPYRSSVAPAAMVSGVVIGRRLLPAVLPEPKYFVSR